MSDAEPTVSIEIERKYDVDESTALPALRDLPGAASLEGPAVRMLDALYFDSADLALAHAHVALRRREGGPDAGWHIKGPRRPDGGRQEFQWPLGDAPVSSAAVLSTDAAASPAPVHIPQHVAEAIAQWCGDAPMLPLARLQNTRTVWNVRDARGEVLVEFVADRVTGSDLRRGGVRAWREWEAELGPAAPGDDAGREALFAALETRVVAAGGRVSASASKRGRALGGEGAGE